MITSSPSPTLYSSAHASPLTFSPAASSYYDDGSHRSSSPAPRQTSPSRLRRNPAKSTLPTKPSPFAPRSKTKPETQMVDASTQYSPIQEPNIPPRDQSRKKAVAEPTTTATFTMSPPAPAAPAGAASAKPHQPQIILPNTTTAGSKRSTPADAFAPPDLNSRQNTVGEAASPTTALTDPSITKRARPANRSLRPMPSDYSLANTRDLVQLISSMLLELIRFNDTLPLSSSALTRFHSRAPPAISVLDYLQRLTTHATLSPPILLSMVFYIDRLCALYPAFTISSLTVHRFLITSATVASKGLSDSFWTNKTYARVGGVSLRELALLELEFLWRVEWRIVPKPEVLVEYYRNLVSRSDEYEIIDDDEDSSGGNSNNSNQEVLPSAKSAAGVGIENSNNSSTRLANTTATTQEEEQQMCTS